jgi:PUA-domain protein
MPEVLRRYFLRKSERKSLLRKVSETLGIDAKEVFGSKPQIEVMETARHNIFLVSGLPVLAKSGEDLFPTLFFKDFLPLLPEVVVDMGAVPHLCSGADIMAPGIVEMRGDFTEKSLVLVLDKRNRKPIAIAQSIFNSKSAKALEKGKLFKNLHHVGDDIWEVIKAG